MNAPVDLLLITWNRREYLERTLPTLLADPADFRLYCWDNGSTDGTQDLIASLDDPRVVAKRFNPDNAGQRQPCLWFFEEARSDVIGKIDDDILLPQGWTERFAEMIRKDSRFGVLGCWIFREDEWDAQRAAHSIIEVGDYRVFRSLGVQGQSCLARRKDLQNFTTPPASSGYGFPVDQLAMTREGKINGIPVPVEFGHNMDDPTSPYYRSNRSGALGEDSALSARHRGFASAGEYSNWIRKDAKYALETPFDVKFKHSQVAATRPLLRRVASRVKKALSGFSHNLAKPGN